MGDGVGVQPDLAAWLLACIQVDEAALREQSQNPWADMDVDELHNHRVHPAYEYATTEGQRKAWDYSDVPPDGDGWERNTTRFDPEGWERFDFHEESYWRRLRPDGQREWQPSADVRFRLVECDTKRRIVELHKPSEWLYWNPESGEDEERLYCPKCAVGESCTCCLDSEDRVWPCETLRLLALPYRDRDGYVDLWAPDGRP